MMYARDSGGIAMARNLKPSGFVGTSGFSYDSWKGIFYPEGIKSEEMLPFYARTFATVEINSTFYHVPAEKTIERWRGVTPPSFVFAVKGSRYITHRLRLVHVHEPLGLFYSRVKGLGKKLGVVLFQMPPSVRRDDELLADFLGLLDAGVRHAIEFRHESWFDDGVYELLRRFGVAFCCQSHPKMPAVVVRSADFLYVRFHGVPKLYVSNYPENELARWAGMIREAAGGSASVYCYFNNDVDGHAVANARTLHSLLGRGAAK
jgi:uncharacterized protein YecE (DUF72 family)